MKLSEEEIETIANRLKHGGVNMNSLFDDCLDHLCCAMEVELDRGKTFEKALDKSIHELAPGGLSELENQTRYLLNSKSIIIMKKLMYSLGFLGSASFAAGILFKLMHWPGANIMLISGIVALLLIFVPLWAVERYKVEISKAMSTKFKFIGGISAALMFGLSVIFKILHLQGASVLLVLSVFVFIFAFLPFLFFSMYKKSVS